MTLIQKALAFRRGQRLDGDKGFTLIELLVVVIIIGILAAIAVPVYIGVQSSARDASVVSDLTNDRAAVVGWSTSNPNETVLPLLTSANYTTYGYSNSGAYSTTPTFKSGSTPSLFCIDAVSTTGSIYRVSSTGTVKKGTACTAATSGW